jgi:enamine deaminase RidA (YjgF/YER057c/UK114 family)
MTPLTPPDLPAPFGRYSHGVAVPEGCRFVLTSGQLGLDLQGQCAEDALSQARQCFANCAAILRSGGMTAADVVRINAFVTDRAHMPDYMKARDEFCAGLTALPASTLVIVSGFTRPEFKVEVEITAARSAG